MQSLQDTSVPPLALPPNTQFSNSDTPTWMQDQTVFTLDWFSLNGSHLIQCTKRYVNELKRWRTRKKQMTTSRLKGILKNIMTVLRSHIIYVDQERLVESELEEELTALISMYIDMELKVWIEKRKNLSKAGVPLAQCEQSMSEKLLFWLYTMLNNRVQRVDALLDLHMAYVKCCRPILDPVFRKVLSEMEHGPLTDEMYVRYMLVFKLWREQVLHTEDGSSVALRAFVVNNLVPRNMFSNFNNKLRSCLRHVPPHITNVPRFHMMPNNINLKESCRQFLQFDKVNMEAISTVSLDFADISDEEDEVTALMKKIDKRAAKKKALRALVDKQKTSVPSSQSSMIIDLTADDPGLGSSQSDVIDLTVDESPVEPMQCNKHLAQEDVCDYKSPSHGPVEPYEGYISHQSPTQIKVVIMCCNRRLEDEYEYERNLEQNRRFKRESKEDKLHRSEECRARDRLHADKEDVIKMELPGINEDDVDEERDTDVSHDYLDSVKEESSDSCVERTCSVTELSDCAERVCVPVTVSSVRAQSPCRTDETSSNSTSRNSYEAPSNPMSPPTSKFTLAFMQQPANVNPQETETRLTIIEDTSNTSYSPSVQLDKSDFFISEQSHANTDKSPQESSYLRDFSKIRLSKPNKIDISRRRHTYDNVRSPTGIFEPISPDLDLIKITETHKTNTRSDLVRPDPVRSPDELIENLFRSCISANVSVPHVLTKSIQSVAAHDEFDTMQKCIAADLLEDEKSNESDFDAETLSEANYSDGDIVPQTQTCDFVQSNEESSKFMNFVEKFSYLDIRIPQDAAEPAVDSTIAELSEQSPDVHLDRSLTQLEKFESRNFEEFSKKIQSGESIEDFSIIENRDSYETNLPLTQELPLEEVESTDPEIQKVNSIVSEDVLEQLGDNNESTDKPEKNTEKTVKDVEVPDEIDILKSQDEAEEIKITQQQNENLEESLCQNEETILESQEIQNEENVLDAEEIVVESSGVDNEDKYVDITHVNDKEFTELCELETAIQDSQPENDELETANEDLLQEEDKEITESLEIQNEEKILDEPDLNRDDIVVQVFEIHEEIKEVEKVLENEEKSDDRNIEEITVKVFEVQEEFQTLDKLDLREENIHESLFEENSCKENIVEDAHIENLMNVEETIQNEGEEKISENVERNDEPDLEQSIPDQSSTVQSSDDTTKSIMSKISVAPVNTIYPDNETKNIKLRRKMIDSLNKYRKKKLLKNSALWRKSQSSMESYSKSPKTSRISIFKNTKPTCSFEKGELQEVSSDNYKRTFLKKTPKMFKRLEHSVELVKSKSSKSLEKPTGRESNYVIKLFGKQKFNYEVDLFKKKTRASNEMKKPICSEFVFNEEDKPQITSPEKEINLEQEVINEPTITSAAPLTSSLQSTFEEVKSDGNAEIVHERERVAEPTIKEPSENELVDILNDKKPEIDITNQDKIVNSTKEQVEQADNSESIEKEIVDNVQMPPKNSQKFSTYIDDLIVKELRNAKKIYEKQKKHAKLNYIQDSNLALSSTYDAPNVKINEEKVDSLAPTEDFINSKAKEMLDPPETPTADSVVPQTINQPVKTTEDSPVKSKRNKKSDIESIISHCKSSRPLVLCQKSQEIEKIYQQKMARKPRKSKPKSKRLRSKPEESVDSMLNDLKAICCDVKAKNDISDVTENIWTPTLKECDIPGIEKQLSNDDSDSSRLVICEGSLPDKQLDGDEANLNSKVSTNVWVDEAAFCAWDLEKKEPPKIVEHFAEICEEFVEDLCTEPLVVVPPEMMGPAQMSLVFAKEIVSVTIPEILESCVLEECRIQSIQPTLVKCRVNGKHKTNKQVMVRQEGRLQTLESFDEVEEFQGGYEIGNAVLCELYGVATTNTHELSEKPTVCSTSSYNDNPTDDYNLKILADMAFNLQTLPCRQLELDAAVAATAAAACAVQPEDDPKLSKDKDSEIMIDKIEPQRIFEEDLKITIPNTAHLQLCPDDYEIPPLPLTIKPSIRTPMMIPPLVDPCSVVNTCPLVTPTLTPGCIDFFAPPPKVQEIKKTDTSTLKHSTEKILQMDSKPSPKPQIWSNVPEKTTNRIRTRSTDSNQKQPVPEVPTTSRCTRSSDKREANRPRPSLSQQLGRYRSNDSEKQAKVETKTPPPVFIRASRPGKIMPGKRKNEVKTTEPVVTEEPKPKIRKPSSDELFDELLEKHKKEEMEKKEKSAIAELKIPEPVEFKKKRGKGNDLPIIKDADPEPIVEKKVTAPKPAKPAPTELPQSKPPQAEAQAVVENVVAVAPVSEVVVAPTSEVVPLLELDEGLPKSPKKLAPIDVVLTDISAASIQNMQNEQTDLGLSTEYELTFAEADNQFIPGENLPESLEDTIRININMIDSSVETPKEWLSPSYTKANAMPPVDIENVLEEISTSNVVTPDSGVSMDEDKPGYVQNNEPERFLEQGDDVKPKGQSYDSYLTPDAKGSLDQDKKFLNQVIVEDSVIHDVQQVVDVGSDSDPANLTEDDLPLIERCNKPPVRLMVSISSVRLTGIWSRLREMKNKSVKAAAAGEQTVAWPAPSEAKRKSSDRDETVAARLPREIRPKRRRMQAESSVLEVHQELAGQQKPCVQTKGARKEYTLNVDWLLPPDFSPPLDMSQQEQKEVHEEICMEVCKPPIIYNRNFLDENVFSPLAYSELAPASMKDIQPNEKMHSTKEMKGELDDMETDVVEVEVPAWSSELELEPNVDFEVDVEPGPALLGPPARPDGALPRMISFGPGASSVRDNEWYNNPNVQASVQRYVVTKCKKTE